MKSKSARASPKKAKRTAHIAPEEPPRGTVQSAGEVEDVVAIDAD